MTPMDRVRRLWTEDVHDDNDAREAIRREWPLLAEALDELPPAPEERRYEPDVFGCDFYR